MIPGDLLSAFPHRQFHTLPGLLERPHTTRFPSYDGSNWMRYVTTGHRRGSWQTTAIPSDCLESWPTESQRVSHYTTSCRRRRRGGPSQVVVSSKSCSVRLLLDSWAALPNSNPNACMPMQVGSLYHFYDGLWYDPAERRTHDLPCERRTRYRLSQPDTVI